MQLSCNINKIYIFGTSKQKTIKKEKSDFVVTGKNGLSPNLSHQDLPFIHISHFETSVSITVNLFIDLGTLIIVTGIIIIVTQYYFRDFYFNGI